MYIYDEKDFQLMISDTPLHVRCASHEFALQYHITHCIPFTALRFWFLRVILRVNLHNWPECSSIQNNSQCCYIP